MLPSSQMPAAAATLCTKVQLASRKSAVDVASAFGSLRAKARVGRGRWSLGPACVST